MEYYYRDSGLPEDDFEAVRVEMEDHGAPFREDAIFPGEDFSTSMSQRPTCEIIVNVHQTDEDVAVAERQAEIDAWKA